MRWVVIYEWLGKPNDEAFSSAMRWRHAVDYVRIFADAKGLELVRPRRFAGLRIPRRLLVWKEAFRSTSSGGMTP